MKMCIWNQYLKFILLGIHSGMLWGVPVSSGFETNVHLIPKPVSAEMREGRFTLRADTRIVFRGGVEIEGVARYLEACLEKPTGYDLVVRESDWWGAGRNGEIRLKLGENGFWEEEGYRLIVSPRYVIIEANTAAGLFYGVQTLRQLLPPEGMRQNAVEQVRWDIPCLTIDDRPRFKWRGLMLDVSRHFLPKSYILDLIDDLAFHKLNTFHWHLVDDQGWRIEIERYPRLTDVGAWRVDREHLHWGDRDPQKPGEKATYGGYYTQEDIREIVAYARSRFVQIVPEIEMPAHVTSALASYPELSCTGGPFSVPPGSVWPVTDIYCAGKEETFEFLEGVLEEVIDLFPGEYIHVGGDEATKTEWEKCDLCRKRMHDEGLNDVHALQAYFIQRIGRFLRSRGKRLIGWDEIMDGGRMEDAVVMSWRGWEQGERASRLGHEVVFCPTSHCYINFYQGDIDLEPLSYRGYLPLSKVYSFDPVPFTLDSSAASRVLGGQVNLWTEFVPDENLADYMIHPRIDALAEAVWTPNHLRDWEDFAKRVEVQFRRYEAAEIPYALSGYQVRALTESDLKNRALLADLRTELPGAEIRYTLDGSDPGPDSPLYHGPFRIESSHTLKSRSYRMNKMPGPVMTRRFVIHKATAKPVTLVHPYDDAYDGGGEYALTNSLRGSKVFMDGRWQGYKKNDMVAVIDLGELMQIQEIRSGFLQRQGSWIFFPRQVIYEVSRDGQTYKDVARLDNDISPRRSDTLVREFSARFGPMDARYIRVTARHIGRCPDWHYAAGGEAWLFVDEIVVE